MTMPVKKKKVTTPAKKTPGRKRLSFKVKKHTLQIYRTGDDITLLGGPVKGRKFLNDCVDKFLAENTFKK